ncbi:MAG: hypothetical protein B9S38_14350 [Verrucomicrobiia bacterium Tous-C4TDCM]|nr:MAG: hypothetical protein B9S38_14350 [Verrucomicrobiae bacterium Tous-C4TDCM]
MKSFGEEVSREEQVREFDEAFDRVVQALSEVYLVNSGDGDQIKGAPIWMDRFFDPCLQHTIVVSSQAWHPDVVSILREVLQTLPAGWTFAIDATEFPPGQALIVVEADGTVHGWSYFSARSTLTAFGFEKLEGPLTCAWFWITSVYDEWRSELRLRAFKRKMKSTRIEDLIQYNKD